MRETIEKIFIVEANTFRDAIENGTLPTIGAKYEVTSLDAILVEPGLLSVTVRLEIEKEKASK